MKTKYSNILNIFEHAELKTKEIDFFSTTPNIAVMKQI